MNEMNSIHNSNNRKSVLEMNEMNSIHNSNNRNSILEMNEMNSIYITVITAIQYLK